MLTLKKITMKKIVAFLLLTTLVGASCKKEKIIEEQKDLIFQILTDGFWSVTLLTVNTTDNTPDFAGYRFKFKEDKSVDASFNTIFVKTGTWDASTTTMTTTSNFVGATQPLSLLNGTWKIDRSGSRFVEATQTNGTEVKKLKMYRE